MLFSRQIQQFIAVAKTGSFIRAAEEISLTPSAISHGIRELEERVGKKLIVRMKTGTSLTEAGKFLYNELAPIYEKGQEIIKRTRHEKEKIVIWVEGFYFAVWPRRLQNLIEKFGDRIEIHYGNSGLNFESIVNENCDILLSVFNDLSAPLTCDVRRIALPIESIGILASGDTASRYKTTIQMLKNEAIFLRSVAIKHRTFDTLKELLIKDSINCNFIGLPDIADVCGAVSMGLGISLITEEALSHPIISDLNLKFLANPFPFEFKIHRCIYYKESRLEYLSDIISYLQK